MFNFDSPKNFLPLFSIALLMVCMGCSQVMDEDETVYLGNGIKIGEVSDTTAIIWARTTSLAEPFNQGSEFLIKDRKLSSKLGGLTDEELGPEGRYGLQLPEGLSLDQVVHAVPGSSGEVRLTYFESGKQSSRKTTGWQAVDPNRDYTKHFPMDGLKPATEYSITVEARKNKSSRTPYVVNSTFTTAQEKDKSQKVTLAVTTCTGYLSRDAGDNGHHIYASMLKMNPDFFVHAGDIIYYDQMEPYVTHIDLARHKWNRMFGFPNTRAFLNEVPSYFMKDDHDSWDNDCWPTMTPEMGAFTYEDGRTVYDEQVPMSDKKHYRTFRWGKDLQIWLMEVRDFRTPNFYPDGPDKSLWGAEQMKWFKETVEASDATFKLLISPTPIVGPDHLWKGEKNDNHVDEGWATEGNMLREYIGKQKNMYYICGDRHWQYISKHPETGMIEYAAGASTDKHSLPIDNPDKSRHLYYKPDVGGFLSVTVDRVKGVPTATFTHHGVMGEVYNEDVR